jgi:hypothetical protein
VRRNKQTALKLRLSGKSYSQITKFINVPKSTLSGWLSNVVISDDIINKINRRGQKKSIAALLRVNKRQTDLARSRVRLVRKSAEKEIKNLSDREVMLVGAALYWAEGYKRPIVKNGREITHHAVSLTNSDPDLVKVFLKYLKILDVPDSRIKITIRVFEHQNPERVESYWQKILKLPAENFLVNRVGLSKSSANKRPFNRLEYGVLQVRVYDTDLFYKIMGHIDGLQKNR